MLDERKKRNLSILFVFSLLSVFWVLSAQNSFCFDDISLLLKVSTSSYEDIFNFWPHAAYADRPVGVIFVKFLYDVFGLDYGCFHATLVILHLCNTLLVFVIVESIFQRKYEGQESCFFGGILSAAFFGMWAKTHMAVQWVAAIYDLLGTFWSLLSILFYLRYRRIKDNQVQNLAFTVFFYYLAIRTKEMFLILPILFMIYEIWEMVLEQKIKRFTLSIFVNLAVFILFFGKILYCKVQGSMTNDVDNPYYQSFNPVRLVQNLLKYCMLCFDLENAGWNYIFSISGLVAALLLCTGVLIAFWRAAVHKQIELLFCYIAAGISIVVVLPMVNQVHALYLYFPSVFIGLLLACVINGLQLPDCVPVIMMCLFMASNLSGSAQGTKSSWIENAKVEKAAWNDIENIKPPISGSTMYIRNMDGISYTPFFYGEGDICKLLYQDTSLKVDVLEEDDNPEFSKPYVLCNYQDGRLIEIERNENKELHIIEVHQYLQEDGSLILGIVPDKIYEGMTVYADGGEQTTIAGDGFLSVQIPKELLQGKEIIQLIVKDQYGTESENYFCQINKKE